MIEEDLAKVRQFLRNVLERNAVRREPDPLYDGPTWEFKTGLYLGIAPLELTCYLQDQGWKAQQSERLEYKNPKFPCTTIRYVASGILVMATKYTDAEYKQLLASKPPFTRKKR